MHAYRKDLLISVVLATDDVNSMALDFMVSLLPAGQLRKCAGDNVGVFQFQAVSAAAFVWYNSRKDWYCTNEYGG